MANFMSKAKLHIELQCSQLDLCDDPAEHGVEHLDHGDKARDEHEQGEDEQTGSHRRVRPTVRDVLHHMHACTCATRQTLLSFICRIPHLECTSSSLALRLLLISTARDVSCEKPRLMPRCTSGWSLRWFHHRLVGIVGTLSGWRDLSTLAFVPFLLTYKRSV